MLVFADLLELLITNEVTDQLSLSRQSKWDLLFGLDRCDLLSGFNRWVLLSGLHRRVLLVVFGKEALASQCFSAFSNINLQIVSEYE